VISQFSSLDALLMDICDARFQRPPGALPSSLLGYEALTGSLDDFGFEDYLNSKTFCHMLLISHFPSLYHMYKDFCNSL
jgi:hypothetical protein